jgi:hypothetical protein
VFAGYFGGAVLQPVLRKPIGPAPKPRAETEEIGLTKDVVFHSSKIRKDCPTMKVRMKLR